MILRFQPRKALIFSFAALGPLGNILTPHFLPDAFRIYYFLLPCFPIFFFMLKERFAKIALFFLPFLIFSFASTVYVNYFGSANEDHTLFRFFLLLCQFLFVVGAASSLSKKEEIFSLLKIYVLFYFISVAVGYLLFFGYYLHAIPFTIVQRFCVLAQFGWGLLRFSPGSYPNEYGVVSSFVLSVLLLIHLDKQHKTFGFSGKWIAVLFAAAFPAFLLATTRAAYLSFLISILYISWKTGYFTKYLFRICCLIGVFLTLLTFFKVNMFKILILGFSQKITKGSLGARYFTWQEAFQQFEGNELFGVGFASLTNIHNVYMQLLFELGFIGIVLFIGSLFLVFLESFFKYPRPIEKEGSFHFLQKVKFAGLINVLTFAASNHNLNHHLTWFVLFLCFANGIKSSSPQKT